MYLLLSLLDQLIVIFCILFFSFFSLFQSWCIVSLNALLSINIRSTSQLFSSKLGCQSNLYSFQDSLHLILSSDMTLESISSHFILQKITSFPSSVQLQFTIHHHILHCICFLLLLPYYHST